MVKIYRKYFRNAVKHFLVYLFLPLFFFAATAVVDIVYASLLEIAPNIIPSYDRVLEKEAYQAFSRTMNVISALLAVFAVSFATGIYDNARYEDVITKTDGLYKVREEFPAYFQKTLPSDIIAVALPSLVFVALSSPAYPEKFLDYFGAYLAPHLRVIEAFSPLFAFFAIFCVALLARILAMPKALDRYRALWLTSFVDS